MWVWFVLAGVSLILELMTGSFYLLFLAVGMVMGGITAWLDMSFYWQVFAFILTAILCVFVFRLFGISKQGSSKTATSDTSVNLDIGSVVKVSHWTDRQTTVTYRGAPWKAILAEDELHEEVGEYVITDFVGSVLVLKRLQK